LVKTKEQSAGSHGLLGGSSLTDVDNYPHRAGQTATRAITVPRDAKGGPKESISAAKRMSARVAEKLKTNERLRRLMKQVRMIDTTEGVRIDLVDDADFSMFVLGTTVLTSDATLLLRTVADAVGPEQGELTIRGHTDSLPWKNHAEQNNWSLSAGRAETTRQALIRDGVGAGRFRRIEGVADRELLIAGKPEDPRNRRISILLTGH
jgi:chemotaxis protein MotB